MDPHQWSWKLKNDGQKVPNQAKAKKDGVINPRKYNFKKVIPLLQLTPSYPGKHL